MYLAFGQSFAEMFLFALSESPQVIRKSQMNLNLFSFQSELLKLFWDFLFIIPRVSRSPSHAVLMVRSAIQAEIVIYYCSKLSVPAVPALSI